MAKTEKVQCPTCEGTGRDPSARYTESRDCPTCEGSGQVSKAKADGVAEAAAATSEPEKPEEEGIEPDGVIH